ncbi:pirin family protein [Pleurocapsa sp. PCC 7319]|uniref:pirin family protein n=1 Tax=Pleurocapsa sp. PCC 7319 TaxID=118161 RepID=UPI0003479A87|nr:pirin family protein [Pleurocapsa sp. PCC 7319]
MITVRPAQDRGNANFGWLDSRHTFSFGSYYDPNHMGFSSLRVINEDKVKPGQGFGTHSHRDMEIISYVLEGELAHKDSIGNGSVIRPGDVQRMSAGTGIAHSEFNAFNIDLVHFLQIWILPKQGGIEPSYEQKHFDVAERQGQLRLVASPDGRNNSVTIHQDTDLYVATLNNGDRVNYSANSNRSLWIQIAKGGIEVNGRVLNGGDGAAIAEETEISLSATTDNTEILLFDLA